MVTPTTLCKIITYINTYNPRIQKIYKPEMIGFLNHKGMFYLLEFKNTDNINNFVNDHKSFLLKSCRACIHHFEYQLTGECEATYEPC